MCVQWLPTPRVTAALLACLLAAGCAALPGYRTERFGRGYDGIRGVRMVGNVLPAPGRADPLLELNAERRDVQEGGTEFSLMVDVAGGEPLLIPSGETLTVIADGDTTRLSGPGSAEHRRFSATYQGERAWFPADTALLRRIAGARAVQVRVRGGSRTVRGNFGPTNLDRFREWVTRYVNDPAPLPAPTSSRAPR